MAFPVLPLDMPDTICILCGIFNLEAMGKRLVLSLSLDPSFGNQWPETAAALNLKIL